jgi:hypothetical protein
MVCLKHIVRNYVNCNCPKGYSDFLGAATSFDSVFDAMKYLMTIRENVSHFEFIDDEPTHVYISFDEPS